MTTTPQQVWIENARRATAARPVRLGKIPKWARQVIQRAYREEGGRAGRYLDMTILNDDRWRGLFDHWGASQIAYRDGSVTPTFCTEPYAGRRHVEMALQFADWLGCDVEIGGSSWWYPGSTVRIEFCPRAADPR
jgi:hypothetical protein